MAGTLDVKLSEKVLLASLNVSCWTGRAFDEKATSKVASSANVDTKAGRFNKALLPQKPEEFTALIQQGNAIRDKFRQMTLAYQQDGIRLMPVKVYVEWTEYLQKQVEIREKMVKTFVDAFPTLVLQAQIQLKTLFNKADYPLVTELPEKFTVANSFLPFTDVENLTLALNQADVDRLKVNIANSNAQSVAECNNEIVQRLFQAVMRLAQRSCSDANRFHDSVLRQLKDEVQLIPQLNFMDDQRINEFVNEASQLLIFDAEAIRSSPVVKNNVSNQAVTLAENMANSYGLAFDDSFLAA